MKTYKLLYLSPFLVFFLALSLHSSAQLTINTIAGNGTPSYSGDEGAATAAEINTPNGVAVDLAGNIYFTDEVNNRIRKIDPSGIITTIAGTGEPGFSGDGGPATSAKLADPRGIAVDAASNVYFSDYINNRVRKVSASGIITTIAGNGFATYSGDGLPATATGLNFPWGVAIDAAGNIFIADQLNNRIRKINTSGIITTICGTGTAYYSGDGVPATDAALQYPIGVAVDGTGNVYIADNGNNRIRKINTSGIISTIAGSVTYGFTGDGGPSADARLFFPEAVAVDAAGDIFISDLNNKRIREIDASGIISTIAGNGTIGFSGDDGPAVLGEINNSTGVAVDGSGNVYIADNNNNRVRILHVVSHAPYFTGGHEQHLTFCATEFVYIDSLLSVFDGDLGQTETWSLIDGPIHGIAGAAYTTTSTGTTMTTSGLTYQMGVGGTVSDTFKVRVTDGTSSDTTTIYVTVQNQPLAGYITGIDSLCPGDTVTFADTATGGVWEVSNTSASSVTPAGLVTALAPGTVTVTYTVTNLCGIAQVSRPLLIRSDCPTLVNTVSGTPDKGINSSPNPSDGTFTASLVSDYREEVRFTVTDILGHVVKELRAATNIPANIQLSEPAGIYLLSATTAHGRWTEKLVIEK